MATGYCVKCKEKGVELTDAEVVQTAKGGYMAKGKHAACGTTVCAMMSKENAEKAVADGAKKSYQITFSISSTKIPRQGYFKLLSALYDACNNCT